MSKKDWESFEDSCAKFLKSESLKFIYDNKEVNFYGARRLKKKLLGTNKTKHQIDIVLKKGNLFLCGECKFHKSPVEKSEVMAFIKTIDNLREHKTYKNVIPIFISSSQFNKGAISMLDYYDVNYFIFYPTERPHFILKQVNVKKVYYSKNKPTKVMPTDKFYNDFHGQSETIENTINMFDMYKIAKTNKPFRIENCKRKTLVEASKPFVEIRKYNNNSIGSKVIKIIFEFIPEKTSKTKEGRPFDKKQIGLLTINDEHFEVFNDNSFLKIEKFS